MQNKTIYLDNAATTFPKPENVYTAMDFTNRNCAVNAGRGSYKLARDASQIIDNTRVKLSKLVGYDKFDNIIFTTSATAAINQILRGIQWNKGDVVYVTPYEHNAIMRTLYSLSKEYNFEILRIPIYNETYEIDLEKMDYLFTQRKPKIVCATHVSNVTGYILPIEKIARSAKNHGALSLIDGSQALGLVPFKLNNYNIDFYVFAGHKTLYGPFGVAGFIYNSAASSLKNSFTGGTGSNSLSLEMPQNLPHMFEASSHNIVAVAGLNAALDYLQEKVAEFYKTEKEISDYLIELLKGIEGITLYLPKNLNNHIGIVSFNLDNYIADEVGLILDQDYNIAIRTGYHCTPLIHEYLQDERYNGTVRVSVGRYTTKKDIQYLVDALKELTYY